MEDSFRVRVEKAFGSLASSSSSSSASSNTSSSPSYFWCLTDEEIERREWNRERDNPDDIQPKPYPPNLDGFFANQRNLGSIRKPVDFSKELEADLLDLNDADDKNDDEGKQRDRGSSSRQLVKPDDHDDEEWDIRSSMGLDCTLDYEEEEDKYDIVAIGKEKAGDCVYMRDIIGSGTDDINFYSELPNTFEDVTRDPRANHMAAKLRLKEDAEAAGKFFSLRVSDTGPLVADTQNYTLEEGANPKSILKRKENQTDLKSAKRVRFDPECKNGCEEEPEGAKDVVMDNSLTEAAKISEASFLPEESYGVPDYVRNPSKYTHYTFDSSSDIDEESNKKACMDFLNQLKRSNRTEQQPVDTTVDLPKSITFTPRKKLGDALMVKKGDEFKQNKEDAGKEFMPKGRPIGIAAEEAQESEVCAMEEDEPEKVATKNSSLTRQGRQYRKKATA